MGWRLFLKGGWLALLLLIAAAGCFGASYAQRQAVSALADHDIPAVATVLDKRQATTTWTTKYGGARDRTDYFVAYGFESTSASGVRESQRVRRNVPRSDYDRVAVGDQVAIHHLPEAPTEIEFSPGTRATNEKVLGRIGWATLLAALAIGATAWRPVRRAWRLDVAGLRAKALVERMWTREKTVMFRVRYTDTQGTEHCVAPPAGSLAPWKDVRAGSTVDLIYDPDKPTNVVLD